MRPNFRTETDSMGAIEVPGDALYGAQTARAVQNFPISGLRFPRPFLRALGLIKKHAACTNAALGLLETVRASAIEEAAQEVIDGKLDAHFVLDIFQTGSGTSTNMNANEVIANRAVELMGGRRGDKLVHPLDHVNLGQSSNDVFPTAIHIAALEEVNRKLIPVLENLYESLTGLARDFDPIIKVGRTHLQDATPIRLGQEFGGYASQVGHGLTRLNALCNSLGELALGGTAVGTGLNTHPDFARRTIEGIARETGLTLREAEDHFEAQSARDACVEASGVLRVVALSLIKIANDIRWMASGPRCGLSELRMPATQPGSSIMPGKVNPVMCEMLMQVGVQVIGNDSAISLGNALGSTLELNVMMPLMAHSLLQSVELLTNGVRIFTERCVSGLDADPDHCRATIEQSLAMCTALVPRIGYDAAARIARKAHETGGTVREVVHEMGLFEDTELGRLLDPRAQTGSDP